MNALKTGLEPAIREILVDAFSSRELDRLLRDDLDFDRDAEVGNPGGRRDVADDVVQSLVRSGRLPDLVAAVARARPSRPDVQSLCRKYAVALYGSGPVGADTAGVLERWGVSAGTAGFQRKVTETFPDIDSVWWATRMLEQLRRVCSIEVDGARVGTGFLVGPQAVLTNHHVVEGAIHLGADDSGVTCLFDYYRSPISGEITEGTRVGLRGTFDAWLADCSPPLAESAEAAGEDAPADQLDHALLVLDTPLGDVRMFEPNGPVRGWIKVPSTAPFAAVNSAIAIVQHPHSKEQKVTMDFQSVIRANATRLRHRTNTEPGASGAPCFDARWQLVGLHHFGDPDHDPARYNQAIPIGAIRERLRAVGKDHLLGGDPP